MQAMARPAYAAICNYTGESKPVILFTPTRKHARSTALDMLTFAAADGKTSRFLQVNLGRYLSIVLCERMSSAVRDVVLGPHSDMQIWGAAGTGLLLLIGYSASDPNLPSAYWHV